MAAFSHSIFRATASLFFPPLPLRQLHGDMLPPAHARPVPSPRGSLRFVRPLRCVKSAWDTVAQEARLGGEARLLGRLCVWRVSKPFSIMERPKLRATVHSRAFARVTDTASDEGKERDVESSVADLSKEYSEDEGVPESGEKPRVVGLGRRSRRRSSSKGSAGFGARGAAKKEGKAGRQKFLPKLPESSDQQQVPKQQVEQHEPLSASGEEIWRDGGSEESQQWSSDGGPNATDSDASYRRLAQSVAERAREIDPEEIRLARQRVGDLIRAGDEVEKEIVRMGKAGHLNDSLLFVIQSRLNYARNDNERHVVQCLDLLMRRIEAEIEAQSSPPALCLLNELMHMADDLSADISSSGHSQWQREVEEAMRAAFLPEDPFMLVMPQTDSFAQSTGIPPTITPLASTAAEDTLLRIDFLREIDELLEGVEGDAASVAAAVTSVINESNVEGVGGEGRGLDADMVAIRLRLEERLRIIQRVIDIRQIAATLKL